MLRKVSERRVPQQVTFDQKWPPLICEELLNRFQAEVKELSQSVIKCDEMWLTHFNPETKINHLKWWHRGSPPPKKIKAQPSAAKTMEIVFWDMQSDIYGDFLERKLQLTPGTLTAAHTSYTKCFLQGKA